MDAELSRRLAWYFAYDDETRQLTDEASRRAQMDERRELIATAEKSIIFEDLPAKIQNKIMSAELAWSAEEFPFVPQPWPLRDN